MTIFRPSGGGPTGRPASSLPTNTGRPVNLPKPPAAQPGKFTPTRRGKKPPLTPWQKMNPALRQSAAAKFIRNAQRGK